MASLPSAVDKLRKHLASVIPDSRDLRQADSYLLDVINSLHNGGGEDDEPEGRRRDASGETPNVAGRTALDARFGYASHGAVGLDRMVFDAGPGKRSTPAGLENILKRDAPQHANSVR